MVREEIAVRFSDLHRLASSIPNYLADKVGVDERPTLRTAVEDDFAFTGLDTELLIVEFGEEYHVDITKFDFTGFISEEMGVIESYVGLLLLLLLPLWLMKMLISILISPFQKEWALTVRKFSLIYLFAKPAKARPLIEVLTTGDFVASAAAGYFVKRERVKFKLLR